MYYEELKKILKTKTLWVVVEKGEWHCIAVEAFPTKEEAEKYKANKSNHKRSCYYEVIEQSLEKAFDKFDERTKTKTINDEAEKIAQKVDYKTRTEISHQIHQQYNQALKPIEEAIAKLQYVNFNGD